MIYGQYSDVELASEVTFLKTQLSNPFNAQTEGNRSYARSTTEFRTRLAAATQITTSRSNASFVRHGIADFSSARP